MTRPTDTQIAESLVEILSNDDRVARSPEYLAGRNVAVMKLDEHAPGPWIECPYTPASAQADAWQAGYRDGRTAVAERWTEALFRLMAAKVWP